MKQEQKIWIKGNSKRGKEIIAKLESLGGKNIDHYNGTGEDSIYFISDGYICGVCNNRLLYKVVTDNYIEYKLPKNSFKPFDKVLVREKNADDKWKPYLWGFETSCYFNFVGGDSLDKIYYQVIPFTKDTEYLLGTREKY